MDWIEYGKRIICAIQESDNVQANKLILEFQGAAIELQQENYDLRRERDALQEQLQTIGDLTYEGGVYWKEVSGERDGPYCQRCVDVDRRLVRLQTGESGGVAGMSTARWYSCRGCDTSYDR